MSAPVEAGQIYYCGKGRYRVVEQVRSTGPGGLRYALVRVCGPKGRTRPHPVMGDIPIAVYLTPGREMPPGYILQPDRSEEPVLSRPKEDAMATTATTTTTTTKAPVHAHDGNGKKAANGNGKTAANGNEKKTAPAVEVHVAPSVKKSAILKPKAKAEPVPEKKKAEPKKSAEKAPAAAKPAGAEIPTDYSQLPQLPVIAASALHPSHVSKQVTFFYAKKLMNAGGVMLCNVRNGKNLAVIQRADDKAIVTAPDPDFGLARKFVRRTLRRGGKLGDHSALIASLATPAPKTEEKPKPAAKAPAPAIKPIPKPKPAKKAAKKEKAS